MSTTPYLMWYDDSPKRTATQKIADGVDRFIERFKVAPNAAIVNPLHADATAPAGVEMTIRADVRPNTFWIGRQDRYRRT